MIRQFRLCLLAFRSNYSGITNRFFKTQIILCEVHSARFHRCLTNQAFSKSHGNNADGYQVPEHHYHILHSFPYAKDTLLYLATLLQEEMGHNALRLRIDSRRIEQGSLTFWESVVSVKWPADLVFYGKASSKGESARIAYAQACASFKSMGMLDKTNKPVLYTKEKLSDIKTRRYAAHKLTVKPDAVRDIESWNQKYYDWKHSITYLEEQVLTVIEEPEVLELLREDAASFIDIVSGDRKNPPTRYQLEDISDDLYAYQVRLRNSQDSRIRAILDQRAELPVFSKREEILETIRENPVTLISGDTGSGKSTQIPQYIFESMAEANRGSEARIIVTQPRRISAISIAERIAQERNEDLGKTVGYQVRLEATFPERSDGCIFFCTTGVLLRRLQDNPDLKGVSHVIVDEVHERDVMIDVLLTLLKKAVRNNPELRVILMSASLNTSLLKSYFDNCPTVEVAGYLHPVKDFFLPEICSLVKSSTSLTEEEPKVDLNLLFDLIKHLDKNRPEGAILVFLPGWQEIRTLRNRLMQDLYRPDRHFILTLHSMVPLKEQHLVFEKTGPHQRKIVLATNIAETAITINDVCYVIDSGTQRGQNYDVERGISTLDTQWIAKANALQRKGRAGRVRSGECYRMYSRQRFQLMEQFAKPEILRTSLEKVILDAKLFCPPRTNAVDFFSQLPEPPEFEGIKSAVDELTELKILKPDEDESLTLLGERIAHFTTHPRISIALVYSVFLRCLNPVLSIAGFLSTNQHPFRNRLEDKGYVKQVKASFAAGSRSDHIAVANLLGAWLETKDDDEQLERFCEDLGISHDSMKFIEGIRQVLCEHLYDAYILDDVENATSPLSSLNEHSKNTGFIKAALTAGIGNNVLRVSSGAVRKGRVRTEEIVVTLPETDTIVDLSRESVLFGLKDFPEPWMIYHSKFKSGESRKTHVREVSEIPGVVIALFGGSQLQLVENDDEDEACLVLMGNPRVKFATDLKSAKALFELRQNIESLVEMSLKASSPRSQVESFWDDVHDLLIKLIGV